MLTLKEIIDATQGKVLQKGSLRFSRITHDSRNIQRGDLFVAIRGKRTDGHDHIQEAVRKGATGVLVSRSPSRFPPKTTVICVRDTVRALQEIARDRRKQRNLPVIAITGSSGKTTTKEMIAAVLSEKYSVFKNAGNFNTEIGLPLALSELGPKHDVAVLELGMQKRGEIRELCQIALPTLGVITNIGPAHIGHLKSLQNIAHAKAELLEELPSRSIALLPADDRFVAFLKKKAKRCRIMTYGFSRFANVRAQNMQFDGKRTTFHVTQQGMPKRIKVPKIFSISISLPGEHIVRDALAAISIGLLMGVSIERIRSALRNFRSAPGRLHIRSHNGMTIIDDTYNANPDSMQQALETLTALGKARRQSTIAVLGDMLELGKTSTKYHRQIGQLVRDLKIDYLVTYGNAARHISNAAKNRVACQHAKTAQTAAKFLRNKVKQLQGKGIVLLKASRGMHLEDVARLARI